MLSSSSGAGMHKAINHLFVSTNPKFKLIEEREADKMRPEWTIQCEDGHGDSNNFPTPSIPYPTIRLPPQGQ